MSTLCPFGTLAPGRIVLANDLAVAFRDAFPVSAGYTLIIPRRLVGSSFDTSQKECNALLALLDVTKAGLDAEFHPNGHGHQRRQDRRGDGAASAHAPDTEICGGPQRFKGRRALDHSGEGKILAMIHKQNEALVLSGAASNQQHRSAAG